MQRIASHFAVESDMINSTMMFHKCSITIRFDISQYYVSVKQFLVFVCCIIVQYVSRKAKQQYKIKQIRNVTDW